MPSVCLYFQVHQPYRLRNFTFFDSSSEFEYFDEAQNEEIMRRVADKCYLPTNRLLSRLIDEFQGDFRVTFSISGVALDQMRTYAPDALESFIELGDTGAVEFLAETYHHSLASLYDHDEFTSQVRLHHLLMEKTFGVTPVGFRNTELLYSDQIGELVDSLGYRSVLAEGVDEVLDWRSPNFVYAVPGTALSLLLKNYRLSDDVAFRFSNHSWSEFPLSARKYAGWIHRLAESAETVNLFMDYETFGEHQWEATGIFDFLRHLPSEILESPEWNFKTPSQIVQASAPVAELSYPRVTSWADTARDVSAWRGNKMQATALHQVYELGEGIKRTGDRQLLEVWRRLQSSDHFYYMCTKWHGDGEVHAYFNPYPSPYDAFIWYMNVLKDLRAQLLRRDASALDRYR